MSKKIFHEQMTSQEARKRLFEAVEGKTKEEIEKIKDDYAQILPAILEREHKLAAQGWVKG